MSGSLKPLPIASEIFWTIGFGVPGGADTAIQVIEVTPGMVSASVGTLGYSLSRWVAGDRDHLDLAGVDVALVGEQIVRDHVDAAAKQIVDRRRAAPIEHRRHVEAALDLHQLAEQMAGVGDALVAVVDGVRFGVGDELGTLFTARLARVRMTSG